MTKERWIVAGATLAFVTSVAAYYASRPPEQVRLDLIQQLDAVEKRPVSPSPREWCVSKEVALGGEKKLAIAVLPNARLSWKVTVPPKAFLRLWVGLEQDAWDQEGDGVLFRIGVSDGSTFRDLIVRDVNPSLVAGDRRWVPVTADLSGYGGRELSLVLNTNASPPGQGNDARHDKPVWGDPAIVTMR